MNSVTIQPTDLERSQRDFVRPHSDYWPAHGEGRGTTRKLIRSSRGIHGEETTLVRLTLIFTVILTASCGFPRPPDVPDPTMGDATCQLTAITPELANTGDTLTLDGTFGDTAVVNFPGGASVAANVLGPHRIRVILPDSATAGDLTVTTCDSIVGSLRFRRASFSLGVGVFSTTHDQAVGARQLATLANARSNHTSLVIGGYLYVFGGGFQQRFIEQCGARTY